MTKNQKIIAGVGTMTIILILGVIWMTTENKTPKETTNIDVSAIKTFEECNKAGFPIVRHYPDQCQTSDGRIFVNENPPNETELAKAESAIRTFMGEPNLELKYITQNEHPSNFGVYRPADPNDPRNTEQQILLRSDDGLSEWNRPVYIFQQTNYINDRCEVYQYQVIQKTNQVVEIGIVYPEEVQQGNPTEMVKKRKELCSNNGSLDWPLVSKDQIEQAAFAYLGHDPEHTKFMLRSDIQPQYIPSKPGVENPAANEWRWEDKSYKLPDGLTGDPFPYPTMRIIMSAGGKLVYYLNTTELFTN